MEASIGIHLGSDTRVSAPDRADAYLEIEGRGTTLALFLGADDHARIEVIDRLAEALLEVRVRCMARLVTWEANQADDISESEQRALHGDR